MPRSAASSPRRCCPWPPRRRTWASLAAHRPARAPRPPVVQGARRRVPADRPGGRPAHHVRRRDGRHRQERAGHGPGPHRRGTPLVPGRGHLDRRGQERRGRPTLERVGLTVGDDIQHYSGVPEALPNSHYQASHSQDADATQGGYLTRMRRTSPRRAPSPAISRTRADVGTRRMRRKVTRTLPCPLRVKVSQFAWLHPGSLNEVVDMLPVETDRSSTLAVDHLGDQLAPVDEGAQGVGFHPEKPRCLRGAHPAVLGNPGHGSNGRSRLLSGERAAPVCRTPSPIGWGRSSMPPTSS